MRSRLFSIKQGIRRIAAHPWLSLMFFGAVVSIGAIVGAAIGYDRVMLEPDVLPYRNLDQVTRLILADAAALDTVPSAKLPGERRRLILAQQDVQCFTETGSLSLCLQTLVRDEEGMLAPIQLAAGEAGMTKKAMHQHGIAEGEKLFIDGAWYTVRALPFHLDPGVDVLMLGTVPGGIHTYILALEAEEGTTPEALMATASSAWHLADTAATWELPKEAWREQAAYIRSVYMRNLILSALGLLFGVSQLAALTRYLIGKCRMRNRLSRQWTGRSGLLLEWGVGVTLLALPGCVAGFAVGTRLQNAVAGGSPAMRGAESLGPASLLSGAALLMLLWLLLARQVGRWEGQAEGREEA